MPDVHAICSASASKRWSTCTPSARLEERYKQLFGEETSPYAEEGTLAHAVAELKLLRLKGRLGDADGVTESEFKERMDLLCEGGAVGREMHNATDLYRDIIEEKLMTARATCPDAMLLVEQRLDFSQWVPEGFGTGDAVILSDDMLEVCDLKYGKGVPVSALDNPQARLYGAGAYAAFSDLYSFSRVRNTIIQPRLDSVSEETLPLSQLLDWCETYIKPRAAMAYAGEGEFKAGDHCRFCAARALCRARALEAMSVMEHEGLTAPALIADSEIPEILKVADIAQAWLKDIQSYALKSALQGVQYRGYKLVSGRKPARKWCDEAKVKQKLACLNEDQYLETKLKTPAQIEKLLGKKDFSELLADLTMQSEGAPTLVPMSDNRPEFNSADADFADMT